MILQLKAAGSGSPLIARDLALDIAVSNYVTAVAEHFPGVANVIADLLSRVLVISRARKLPFAQDYASQKESSVSPAFSRPWEWVWPWLLRLFRLDHWILWSLEVHWTSGTWS